MERTVRNRDYDPFIIALVVTILFLIIQLILVGCPIDIDTRTIIADLVSPLVGFITMVGVFISAVRTKEYSKPIARGWFFLGYAQLAYFLGDFLWGILELGLKITPFPSIADIPYLIYYPLFFIAVMQFPSVKQQVYDRFKRALDMVIIITGGMMVFWNYIFGPIIQIQTGVPYLSQILAYAYSLGDLVLFWALVLLLYNRLHEKNGGPLLLVTLGVTVMVFTDCIFSVQSLNETYQSGGILDLGWILQNLLVLLAAIWQFIIAKRFSEGDEYSYTLVNAINRLFSFFPFLWLFTAMIMLIHSHFVDLPMTYQQISIATIVITGLVFSRQIIDSLQIRNLVAEVDLARERNERQARELHLDTLHDFLTGLPNRELFLDRLESAIKGLRRRSDDPFAVLFLDLDEFKSINDSKGHIIGDMLLKDVANRLKNSIRESDTIARLGGDEFLILLENVSDRETLITTTNRVLKELNKKFVVENWDLFISASIGVVVGLKEYNNSTDVLQDADIAMYHAKKAGKSRFAIFKPAMRNQAIRKVLIENELRYALDNKQFRLVYQPIFSLSNDNIVCFEALIRWQNPKLGNIRPDEFIAIAEESGLIIKIGDWILQEACTQMNYWIKLFVFPSSVAINVNISGIQFSRSDFKEKLKLTLKTTGLHPKYLKLEITESVLLDIQHSEIDLYKELKKLGVHLQIDDFGTGYSSLSYLQHLPVDVLKIDRSFVKEINTNEKNTELIRAIVSMARGMGMQTTAEGIETTEQKDLITSLGCDYGQGYLWAKPLEIIELEEFLHNKGYGPI
jgi:diguanylate cyclase